jgi:hypothetical protein
MIHYIFLQPIGLNARSVQVRSMLQTFEALYPKSTYKFHIARQKQSIIDKVRFCYSVCSEVENGDILYLRSLKLTVFMGTLLRRRVLRTSAAYYALAQNVR